MGVAWVAGVPVDDVTMDEAVERIVELVHDGRRTGRCHQVATVNVDFVVNARRDPALRAVLHRTALSIPDGMPIIWGSRLLGTPLRTRVAGADLVEALVARAAHDGLVVSLFGAPPGVAARAAAMLERRHRGARVVGDAGPVFGDVAELTPADLSHLRELRPDVCCVAFGNPKQERFIERFGPSLGIPVMIGVGGTLEFLVGEKRRAPVWMQRSGLEWLHRAVSEPRRLARRYARDAVTFGPTLLAQAWRGRAVHDLHLEPCVRVDPHRDSVVVDLSGVRAADNVVAAEVAAALRSAWRHGRRPAVRCPSPHTLANVVGLPELAAACTGPRRRTVVSRRRPARAARPAFASAARPA